LCHARNINLAFNRSMEKNGSSQPSLRRVEGNEVMLTTIEGGRSYPHDPALRGFQVLYHPGEANRCPACGRSHWYIGRLSAECGFCGTALALAETARTGAGLFVTTHPVRQDVWDEAA
jgi:hypothetical protein